MRECGSVDLYMCDYMFLYIYVLIHMCVYIFVCVYIYIYIYMCIYNVFELGHCVAAYDPEEIILPNNE